MAKIPDSETSPAPTDSNVTTRVSPKALVQEYLEEQLPIYRELRELQRQASTNQIFYSRAPPSSIPFQTNKIGQGRQSPAGDTYFQNQRQRADQANAQTKTGFFKLMRNIVTSHSFPPRLLSSQTPCGAPARYGLSRSQGVSRA